MEIRGHTYISGKFKPADYLRLNLQTNSSQSEWEKAIEIFDDRLYGRYFRPMNYLLNSVKNSLMHPSRYRNHSEMWHPNADEATLMPNGFAVMALVCLLMETLMQFREGYPKTPDGRNKELYKSFLMTKLRFSQTEATRFYEDIRCGILHSAETKKNSCLTIEQAKPVMMVNDSIKVDVEKIKRLLHNYFRRYQNELKREANVSLRVNFIKKMDSIMKKWENSPRFTNLWEAICSQRGHSLEVSAGEFVSIKYADERLVQFDNDEEVMKTDVCEAVCFWNDVDSINSKEGWKYIVPLLDSCRELSDTFIVKAG